MVVIEEVKQNPNELENHAKNLLTTESARTSSEESTISDIEEYEIRSFKSMTFESDTHQDRKYRGRVLSPRYKARVAMLRESQDPERMARYEINASYTNFQFIDGSTLFWVLFYTGSIVGTYFIFKHFYLFLWKCEFES